MIRWAASTMPHRSLDGKSVQDGGRARLRTQGRLQGTCRARRKAAGPHLRRTAPRRGGARPAAGGGRARCPASRSRRPPRHRLPGAARRHSRQNNHLLRHGLVHRLPLFPGRLHFHPAAGPLHGGRSVELPPPTRAGHQGPDGIGHGPLGKVEAPEEDSLSLQHDPSRLPQTSHRRSQQLLGDVETAFTQVGELGIGNEDVALACLLQQQVLQGCLVLQLQIAVDASFVMAAACSCLVSPSPPRPVQDEIRRLAFRPYQACQQPSHLRDCYWNQLLIGAVTAPFFPAPAPDL